MPPQSSEKEPTTSTIAYSSEPDLVRLMGCTMYLRFINQLQHPTHAKQPRLEAAKRTGVSTMPYQSLQS